MHLTDLPTTRPSKTLGFIIGISLILFIYFFTEFEDLPEPDSN
ncbi:hypothetical protein [Evansella cellulosilytica]|nr:hypothetical protein [Evansella cellulosilytica]